MNPPRVLFPSLLALLLTITLPVARAAGPEVPKPTYAGYDEKADVTQQIADALAASQPEDKRVLLVFGANWCGPCRRLHAILHGDKTVAALLKARYEVVAVAVDGRFAAPVRARYGYRTGAGLPALAVLAADGTLLKLQNTAEFGREYPEKRDGVLGFLRFWAAQP